MSNYQLIPTYQDPFYTQVVQMEGTSYLLTWNYSQREDCYYLSIATPDAISLADGIKVVANWPLLHKWADNRLPPGELICKSNSTTQDPAPGLGQIGDGLAYTLYYVPRVQLP
jgi:hypothetical protein